VIPIPNAHRPVIEGRTETGELSGEGRLFLIFALLESIAVDLATMKRRGLWRDDPEEAAAKPELLTDLERQALRDWFMKGLGAFVFGVIALATALAAL
jgi:hypothetical protein